jgi:hypothetical protein
MHSLKLNTNTNDLSQRCSPLTQVFHYSSLINIITFSHTQQPQQFKAWINTPRNPGSIRTRKIVFAGDCKEIHQH